MKIFEKPGPENTEDTLKIALEAAYFQDIQTIVVASNSGETVEKLIAQGLIEEHRERFSLTEKGLYYQGNVSAAFMLSVFEGVSPLKKKMCIGAHEMP